MSAGDGEERELCEDGDLGDGGRDTGENGDEEEESEGDIEVLPGIPVSRKRKRKKKQKAEKNWSEKEMLKRQEVLTCVHVHCIHVGMKDFSCDL